MTLAEILIRVGVDASRVATGLGAAEKSLESFGTRLFFLGSRITAGVSAPVAAAVAAISQIGLEFDQAMTEALAIMDHVSPQMRQRMEGVAKAITETTKFSSTEGAKAFYDLASAGLNATESMQALPVVARFAQAGLIDLAKAGEYLAGAQAALGSKSDDTSKKIADMAKISDVLTKANNIALGTVEDFAKALTNKAGQQLRIFHKDVEEGVAVLAAYAQQNIRGAAAGTQLYMAIRDLARFATKNADAFKAQGIAVFDSAGNMRNMADIIADFENRLKGASNQQAAMLFQMLGMTDRSRAATQALIGYSDSIRDYEKQLRSAGGTTKEVSDNQMQSLKNQLLSVYHQFQNVLIDIFQDFEPLLRTKLVPSLQAMVEVLKDGEKWLKGLSTGSKEAVLGITALLVIAGPLTAFIGSWSLLLKVVAMPLAPLFAAVGEGAQAAGTGLGAAAAGAAPVATLWSTLADIATALMTRTALLFGVFGAGVIVLEKLVGGWGNLTKDFIATVPPLEILRIAWEGLGKTWETIREPLGNVLSYFYELSRLVGGSTWDGMKTLWGYMRGLADVQTEFLGQGHASLVSFFEELAKWIASLNPGVLALLELMKRLSDKAGEAAKQMRDARNLNAYVEGAHGTGDVGLSDNFLQQAGVRTGSGRFSVTGSVPAFGTPLGSMLSRPVTPKDLPINTGPPPGNNIATSVTKDTSLLKAYKTEIAGLGQMYTQAVKDGAPLKEIVEAYGTKFEDAGKKARAWGFELTGAVKTGYDAVMKYNLGEFIRKQDAELVTSGKAFVEVFTKYGTDITTSVKGSTDEQFKAVQDLQNRLIDIGKSGTNQQIVEINRAEKAEIDALNAKSNIAESTRNQELVLIHAYYDHQVDLAKQTYDTITERMHKAGVDTQDVQKETADKLETTWRQMMKFNAEAADGFKFEINDIKKAWNTWYDLLNRPNPMAKFWGSVDTTISPFVREFKNLSDIIGSDTSGFASFVTGFSEVLSAMELGARAAKTVSESFEGIKKAVAESRDGVSGWGADMAKSLIGLATGIVSGVAALSSATDPKKSLTSRIAGGAMAGAELGSSVGTGLAMAGIIGGSTAKGLAVAGVWGAAAGAIVGIFIAVFRGRHTRQEMAKVGHEWGATISEALADQIREQAHSMFQGEDIAAALFNMKEIVKAAGGVNEANLDEFTHKLRDTFTMLDRGLFTVAQAKKVLTENFQDIADAVLNTGEVASKEFTDIIEYAAKWGLHIKAITDFVQGQAERFGTSMEAIVKGTSYSFTGLSDKIDTARQALVDLNNDPEAKQEDIKKATIELQDLLNQQAQAALNSTAKLDALTGVVLAGFNQAMKDGVGIITALNSQGGALDAIIAAYKDLGVTSDNAALAQLVNLRKLQDTYPELVNGVGSLGDAMLALSNIGGLNKDTFAAMQQTGLDMYNDLSAKAAQLGVDNSSAVAMMVPFLEAVISGNKKYGFAIDENTMKLIEQAREMGLLSDEELSTNDILREGLTAIIEALGGTVPEAFKKAAQAAQNAFDDVANDAQTQIDRAADAFRQFDPETVRVPYQFVQVGDDPQVPQMDVPAFGAGGVVYGPTMAQVGERGPEVITPLDQFMGMMHRDREEAVANVYIDGKRAGKVIMSKAKTILRNNGIRS